jgi:hypothetical protein
VATTDQLAALQAQCREVYVDPSLVQYAVKLVSATRTPDKHGLKGLARLITYGASPRATIGLVEGARALAMLRGRSYALPEDMTDLVPDVLRHRVVLSYEGLSEGLTSDALIARIMKADPPPAKPLEHEKRRPETSTPRPTMLLSLFKRPGSASRPRRLPKPAALPLRPGRWWCPPVRRRWPHADALLRRLEWTVLKRLDGLLQGDHRTLMRGTGLDLADLREYQHHDDVRHIDWNVTARLQTPHVRVFTEDREMAAWFLLDLSPSVDFGSGEQRKREVLRALWRAGAPDQPPRQPGGRHAVRLARARGGGRRAARARRPQLQVLRLMQLIQQPPAPPPVRGAPGGCHPPGRPAARRDAHGAPALARCSWCPTSSASPAGKSRWASWRGATTWWRCACSTRWSWSCPTWA